MQSLFSLDLSDNALKADEAGVLAMGLYSNRSLQATRTPAAARALPPHPRQRRAPPPPHPARRLRLRPAPSAGPGQLRRRAVGACRLRALPGPSADPARRRGGGGAWGAEAEAGEGTVMARGMRMKPEKAAAPPITA